MSYVRRKVNRAVVWRQMTFGTLLKRLGNRDCEKRSGTGKTQLTWRACDEYMMKF